MKIFRAIGLGVAIIILKLLVPKVFSGLEHTLLTFFDTASAVLTLGVKNLSAVSASLPVPTVR